MGLNLPYNFKFTFLIHLCSISLKQPESQETEQQNVSAGSCHASVRFKCFTDARQKSLGSSLWVGKEPRCSGCPEVCAVVCPVVGAVVCAVV